MKKNIVTAMVSFILFAGLATPVYALSDTQSMAIQTLVDNACHISGVPGMSISIIDGDEMLYFSSGFADREKGLPASENTIYELASVSKAFTGAGILLLEEQGLLSMADPVQNYLPWFTLKYQGMPVDMHSLTLNDFLHHTSGLTNEKHIQNIPQGNTPDMLQKTVEMLVDAELAFPPGEKYEYGTVNYDVLGLVIEVVSGQSYEDFMAEQVFQPLGLYNTYVYKADAQQTGQLAQGYRTSFSITTPYDAPDYAGNKPAGYIMSSATDMARWMNIQMGVIQDIPEVFKMVIMKSHQGDVSVPAVNEMYYAAGWSVNTDGTIIEHEGGNPNFATEVVILPDERVAICLLSNSANTNVKLVKSIKNILDGNLTQSYKISGRQLLDMVLSSVTIIVCLLAVVFFFLGLRRKKMNKRQQITKKRMLITIVWLTVTVAMCIMCWFFPMFSGYDWSTILVWQTYSILTTFISLAFLSLSVTWFVYAR
ncbi:serine hydrolase [Anaerocolumna sp. AGMB13025]|nr:serine hydrolase domain-containing protein [Anaerocolumna sp. AGMB13025]WFR60240.1 serine hydrolase [Anaerocolumna sp. AGMB13025]